MSMEINHTGKTAVVTGSARGIGKEIAATMAGSGANVILLDVLETVHETADELARDNGVDVIGMEADVSDFDQVKRAIEAASEEVGPPVILTNNAAITTNIAPIQQMAPDEYLNELSINLAGVFHCTKACLDYMVNAEFGRIVNISSGAGKLGGFGQAGYSSSKSGIFGLTKTAALEHAQDGITANTIIPGLIESPASEAIREDMLERIVDRIPTKERGKPEDIATAANFLASDQAKYINGAELDIDAGQRLFTF